jgi:hypothetical protein
MTQAVFPLSMNGPSAVTIEIALMGDHSDEAAFHVVATTVTGV